MNELTDMTPDACAIEPAARPQKSLAEKVLGEFLDWGKTLLFALALFVALNVFTTRLQVHKTSMFPTLRPGEYLLVARNWMFSTYERGEIVIVKNPQNLYGELMVKRVVGLPGEVVAIRNGEVLIDGEPLSEPYIYERTEYEGEWTVPADSYFVLGDNRNQSLDSHMFGFVPKDLMVGKALLRYYPLKRFGSLLP